jgi:hypothetical protein
MARRTMDEAPSHAGRLPSRPGVRASERAQDGGHTFRGSTWRTWLRVEDERRAFERYCAIREREREYLADVGAISEPVLATPLPIE